MRAWNAWGAMVSAMLAGACGCGGSVVAADPGSESGSGGGGGTTTNGTGSPSASAASGSGASAGTSASAAATGAVGAGGSSVSTGAGASSGQSTASAAASSSSGEPETCDGSSCFVCRSCAWTGPCSSYYDTCQANPECIALSECYGGCFGDDQCVADCWVAHPDGQTDLLALNICTYCNECPTSCQSAAYGCP